MSYTVIIPKRCIVQLPQQTVWRFFCKSIYGLVCVFIQYVHKSNILARLLLRSFVSAFWFFFPFLLCSKNTEKWFPFFFFFFVPLLLVRSLTTDFFFQLWKLFAHWTLTSKDSYLRINFWDIFIYTIYHFFNSQYMDFPRVWETWIADLFITSGRETRGFPRERWSLTVESGEMKTVREGDRVGGGGKGEGESSVSHWWLIVYLYLYIQINLVYIHTSTYMRISQLLNIFTGR